MMLARLACRQVWWFSEAAEFSLHKPHLDTFFQGDAEKVLKEGALLAKKYDLEQDGLERLFRLSPKVFIPNSSARQILEDKIKFLNNKEKTNPVAAVFNEFLFDSRHLLLEMNKHDINRMISQLEKLGFTQEKAIALLTHSSNVIHSKFDLLYREKLAILQDYLHYTQAEAVDLFVKQPFLLTCSAKRLRESVVFFVERKEGRLTERKIRKLLEEIGEIFLMGREELVALYQKYRSWDFKRGQLWNILLEHPLLLLNHPGEIFHFKIKMMRKFQFTVPMGKRLLTHYPSALICSVSALEAKFLLARDRLKISIDENNLEYLTFKFGANIRPRAEILIKAKVPYTSENIVGYFKCSEAEFLEKTGVPAAKLEEEKKKFPITCELDIPRKRCLVNYPTEQKLIELSKRYYPKEDLLITAQ